MKPTHELILGGAKSGKSRRAEDLAAHWLAGAGGRSAGSGAGMPQRRRASGRASGSVHHPTGPRTRHRAGRRTRGRHRRARTVVFKSDDVRAAGRPCVPGGDGAADPLSVIDRRSCAP